VNSRKSLRMALWAMSVLLASSVVALGRNGPAADIAMTGNGEASLPSFSETAADQSQGAGCCDVGFGQSCCSRWTASAEFIVLERIGTSNQTLVSTYPGIPSPQTQFTVGQGTDQLYSTGLTQGFAGGPKIGLLYHGDNGYDLEASFFQIDGWNNAASIASGTYTTPVFVAPGGFVQTTDSSTQTMNWVYATRLYNAEINVRWDLCPRVTMLAGFRFVGLWEELQGTIPDPERMSPFWDNWTRNNLYGLQLGEQWKIVNRGPFSMDGLVKAGIFDNVAGETTGVSIFRTVYWESASTNHAAFLGEIDLQCKYQLTPRLLLKIGYEAMWLQGVATAPGQIPETLSQLTPVPHHLPLASVRALGVDSGAGVFYHGATAGLEYAF
jgi:hypothetical protein